MSEMKDVDWQDFFIGGGPPYVYFQLRLDELLRLVEASDEEVSGSNATAEVCLIGLAAHFEAFCKGLFAAAVNICPDTLTSFCDKRNVTIELKAMLHIKDQFDSRLGSLLAEQFDFGSSRPVNGLFIDLLGITPFSAKEEKLYAEFLNDRNLLVHHGGIYTLKYGGQRFVSTEKTSGRNRIHFDSLIIRKSDFKRWNAFLDGLAGKMTSATHNALERFVSENSISLDKRRKRALAMLPESLAF